ncbi:MAG: hypothetical protein H7Y09_04395 [Chitinophagaceae bacterium]|nr:hypothetical protein [Anaerolineae bacterium]
MKRLSLLILLGLLLVMVNAASAQNEDGTISVTCDSGGSFDNGVEVTIVQMRTGFNYTATALGINGFDPVLAVLGENDEGLCTDDAPDIEDFQANLPTTGEIEGQNLNSQVVFNNGQNSGMADIRLVVGGFGNTAGEFLVILEGMAVTDADGIGDIFQVRINELMIASEVNVTAYVISVRNELDPLIFLVDGDVEQVDDQDGDAVACDDAGNANLCWGESESLDGYFVPRANGNLLPGFQYDAMLSLPLDEDMADSFFNFIVNSYQNTSFGDYVIAFHIAIGEVQTGGKGA